MYRRCSVHVLTRRDRQAYKFAYSPSGPLRACPHVPVYPVTIFGSASTMAKSLKPKRLSESQTLDEDTQAVDARKRAKTDTGTAFSFLVHLSYAFTYFLRFEWPTPSIFQVDHGARWTAGAVEEH